MGILDAHGVNKNYLNWVKLTSCLKTCKEGLETFAAVKSIEFHSELIKTVNTQGYNRVQRQYSSHSQMCGQAPIHFDKKEKKWKITCCAICVDFLEALQNESAKFISLKKGNWDNTDSSRWPKDEWEIAKVFMNPGQKKKNRSPSDTDLCGILNFLNIVLRLNLGMQPQQFDTQNIFKVKDIRNETMHSSSFQISQQQFKDDSHGILDLLQAVVQFYHGKIDPTKVKARTQAEEAIEKIKEVQKSDFIITTDAEYKVLKYQNKEFRQKIKELQRKVEEMQCALDGNRDDESLKSMVYEMRKDEQALLEIYASSKDLNVFTERNRVLDSRVKPYTLLTKAALTKAISLLTKVKETIRALTYQNEYGTEAGQQQLQSHQLQRPDTKSPVPKACSNQLQRTVSTPHSTAYACMFLFWPVCIFVGEYLYGVNMYAGIFLPMFMFFLYFLMS